MIDLEYLPLDVVELIEKAKVALPIGTERMYGGNLYQKVANDQWRLKRKEHQILHKPKDTSYTGLHTHLKRVEDSLKHWKNEHANAHPHYKQGFLHKLRVAEGRKQHIKSLIENHEDNPKSVHNQKAKQLQDKHGSFENKEDAEKHYDKHFSNKDEKEKTIETLHKQGAIKEKEESKKEATSEAQKRIDNLTKMHGSFSSTAEVAKKHDEAYPAKSPMGRTAEESKTRQEVLNHLKSQMDKPASSHEETKMSETVAKKHEALKAKHGSFETRKQAREAYNKMYPSEAFGGGGGESTRGKGKTLEQRGSKQSHRSQVVDRMEKEGLIGKKQESKSAAEEKKQSSKSGKPSFNNRVNWRISDMLEEKPHYSSREEAEKHYDSLFTQKEHKEAVMKELESRGKIKSK